MHKVRKITKKEDSKNKLKNNKDNIKSLNSSGITLIALVITIVLNFSYLEMARMNKFEKI